MSVHRVAGAPLDFAALRAELEVPGDFASAALADADAGAANPTLPDEDASDIPFITVDPTGSKDLDQALHVAAAGSGYLISYAIADVAAFVRPGSALDDETHRRAETLYFPDLRVPLHPPRLSEDAASLLPGQLRPAVLWQITLDAIGEVSAVTVRRARVRSREQWDYEHLEAALANASAPPAAVLLPTVGALRQALARKRHAINLDLPQQEVERGADGEWTIAARMSLPIEQHNAELSLLTGMCAARLMLDAGYGVLRTVPEPDPRTLSRLHRIAAALDVTWHSGAPVGDVLDGLHRDNPRHLAFLEHAASLMRGAAYTPFDGAPPAQPLHAGIAAPYTHVTAPLRRLVDRYTSEICLAIQAKSPIPEWVKQYVPELPKVMAEADHRAHAIDRAVVDATEAWLLSDRVGQRFDAVVLDADEHGATISIQDPVVRARCDGNGLSPGAQVQVVLQAADVARRTVSFALAS